MTGVIDLVNESALDEMRIAMQFFCIQACRARYAGITENLHHIVLGAFARPRSEDVVQCISIFAPLFQAREAFVDDKV